MNGGRSKTESGHCENKDEFSAPLRQKQVAKSVYSIISEDIGLCFNKESVLIRYKSYIKKV